MLSHVAKQRIENVMQQGVTGCEISGANLLVLKGHEPIYYYQVGYAEIESQTPIQRDSLFRLYSMTKPVTAVAAMMLMERGAFDLFDPVEKYLPGFKGQKVVENGKEVPAKRPVTIMDLLAMTAGLVYGGESITGQGTGAMWEEMDQRLFGDNPMTTQEAMNRLGQVPLLFHPGESWEYSTCADVLGAVIEVASGKRFSTFLQEELFGPLGMKDTKFYVPQDQAQRLVTTYANTADGGWEVYAGNNLGIINAMDREPAFESGGAGLVSTVDDYAKFATMLLNGGTYEGKRIMRQKTIDYMISRTLTPEQAQSFKNWHTLSGHTYGSLMRIVTDPASAGILTSPGEYGWDGWLGCYFANFPADNLTILFMTNRKDSGTLPITRRLRNIILADLL